MSLQIKRWSMVWVGIFIAALGNAMLAYSGLGNTYWGIAAENISALTGFQFGTSIFILMSGLFVYNRIALKSYRPVLDTLSFITSILFSMFINMFIALLASTVNLADNYYLTLAVWFFGIILMTLGITMYVKINLIVPAFDENMGVFAKLYFNGSFAKAGYLCIAVALVITVIVGFINDKTFLGFNLYTLFIILTFSHFIQFFMDHMKFFDKFVEVGEFENKTDDVNGAEATESAL